MRISFSKRARSYSEEGKEDHVRRQVSRDLPKSFVLRFKDQSEPLIQRRLYLPRNFVAVCRCKQSFVRLGASVPGVYSRWPFVERAEPTVALRVLKRVLVPLSRGSRSTRHQESSSDQQIPSRRRRIENSTPRNCENLQAAAVTSNSTSAMSMCNRFLIV